MCICVYDIYGRFSLYKNGIMLSYNSATIVSSLYVNSLWAWFVQIVHISFVQIQLTFVRDCVIFLSKSVGVSSAFFNLFFLSHRFVGTSCPIRHWRRLSSGR